MPTHRLNPLSTAFVSSNSPVSTPLDSPPSLIYSDFSDVSEVPSNMPVLLIPRTELPDRMKDTITPNMASMSLESAGQRVDASMVVQQVLSKLDNVVEHLRIQGENDAANDIAKSTIEIVQTFNQVTAPWDLQMFQMAPPQPRPRPGLANTRTAGQLRPAVATAGSWASVAAAAIRKDNNGVATYSPGEGLAKRRAEASSSSEDSRVVWVLGWKPGRPMGQITQYVTQGPICSMAYDREHHAVCIVFQHATSASNLTESCQQFEAETGECLFGQGCNVIMGQPYPITDDLQRMGFPWNERRRLTFARSQLFAHGMTETAFRNDIYHIVGEGNVELVWLFNTGNATVVFSSSHIASVIRGRFLEKAKDRNSPYYNIHISFSHDPCEKPMNLITQIDSPTTGRHRSDSYLSEQSNGYGYTNGHANGHINGLSRANSRTQGNLGRRESKRKAPKQDADGWQTVTHKK